MIFQAAHAAQTQAQSNVSIPLAAFRQTDFSALNLSQEQFESVQYLRDAFQRELRDSDNERRSPEYLKQWQSAQAQNNLMLRGMLGNQTLRTDRVPAANRAHRPAVNLIRASQLDGRGSVGREFALIFLEEFVSLGELGRIQ